MFIMISLSVKQFFGNLRYTKDDQKQGRNKVFQRENIKMIK